MAAGDLTTAAQVASYLRLKTASDNDTLADLVTAASKLFAAYCDRTFQLSTHTYTVSGKGNTLLPLPEYPVTGITSLTLDGLAIAERPAVGGQGWVLVDDQLLLDGGMRFPRGIANVAVVYTAGYASIPEDLAQACVETVASWHRRAAHIDETSKTIQGEIVSYSLAEIPKAARMILDLYQRPWPRQR